MYYLSLLIALLSLSVICQSRFVFVRLAHNGVWQPPLQYIRNHTAPFYDLPSGNINGYREWSSSTLPTDYPNSVRCGRDNLAWAEQTEVLKVKAGDTIEFAALYYSPSDWDNTDRVQWDGCPEGRGVCSSGPSNMYGINQEGSSFMYLSRVPVNQDIHTYDGSGEWVKIYTLGFELHRSVDNWITWLPKAGYRLIATLPKQTPAGQYLLRVDHVLPGRNLTPPQMFPSCAHIEVESESTGELPEGVKIPEILSASSTGMMFTIDNLPTSANGYKYPGGPQWDGEKMAEVKAPLYSEV